MGDPVEFHPGEPLHYTLITPAGWAVLVADVSVSGRSLLLDDLGIWPLHTKKLSLSTDMLLQIRRLLMEVAQSEGYTELRVRGFRLSGRNPRRAFAYRWRLK